MSAISDKEIHALAKKAGLAKHGLGWTAWESQLERFARAVAEAAVAVAAVAAERDRSAYEELRAIIDGGSESMTHSDAVEWCQRHADADWKPVSTTPAAPVPDVVETLVNALRLAKDMMILNDLSLPRTFEEIDDALAAAPEPKK